MQRNPHAVVVKNQEPFLLAQFFYPQGNHVVKLANLLLMQLRPKVSNSQKTPSKTLNKLPHQ